MKGPRRNLVLSNNNNNNNNNNNPFLTWYLISELKLLSRGSFVFYFLDTEGAATVSWGGEGGTGVQLDVSGVLKELTAWYFGLWVMFKKTDILKKL